MKSAMDIRVILGLALLATAGLHAEAADAGGGDGQEQARLLLSGRSVPSGIPTPRFVSSTATTAIALDAQAQAREMILGGQIAKATVIDADPFRGAGASDDRSVASNPHEMARRMILGSRSAGSTPTVRLAVKQSL